VQKFREPLRDWFLSEHAAVVERVTPLPRHARWHARMRILQTRIAASSPITSAQRTR
jgi:hypothetical protein